MSQRVGVGKMVHTKVEYRKGESCSENVEGCGVGAVCVAGSVG